MEDPGASQINEDLVQHGLADVTRMELSRLLLSGDSVLTNAVRRLLSDLDQDEEIIAAFGNAP